MLHQYDPQTEEEMKELQDYLHRLSTTVSIPVAEEESDNEDIDMSLWDLLWRVSNKSKHTLLAYAAFCSGLRLTRGACSSRSFLVLSP